MCSKKCACVDVLNSVYRCRCVCMSVQLLLYRVYPCVTCCPLVRCCVTWYVWGRRGSAVSSTGSSSEMDVITPFANCHQVSRPTDPLPPTASQAYGLGIRLFACFMQWWRDIDFVVPSSMFCRNKSFLLHTSVVLWYKLYVFMLFVNPTCITGYSVPSWTGMRMCSCMFLNPEVMVMQNI